MDHQLYLLILLQALQSRVAELSRNKAGGKYPVKARSRAPTRIRRAGGRLLVGVAGILIGLGSRLREAGSRVCASAGQGANGDCR